MNIITTPQIKKLNIATYLLLALLLAMPMLLHAQTSPADATSSDATLRATIENEIMADPRSQSMTSAQISAMVDALTQQAQKQGVTAQDLTYRPTIPGSTNANTAETNAALCQNFSCALSNAFGLDGSDPIIPLGLFIAAALFILIFSIMREAGHPHAQLKKR
jgi:hypothetical protein